MTVPSIKRFEFGKIILDDGTTVILRIAIVNVKKVDTFSPFGGFNFAVKVIGGIGIN